MAASITVHLQIFKGPQLLRFSTDLDETGIKIHGLLRSFIYNIEIIRVAIPFNAGVLVSMAYSGVAFLIFQRKNASMVLPREVQRRDSLSYVNIDIYIIKKKT